MLDSGFLILDDEYWILDTGYSILDVIARTDPSTSPPVLSYESRNGGFGRDDG